MRISFVHAAIAATLLVPTTGFSWGQKGHQMVNRVAVTMVTHPVGKRFLEANKDQVVAFASVPDTRWKSGASSGKEKPMHWFQMDRYGRSRLGEGVADLILGDAREQLGHEFVEENGLAMWRVSDLYAKLVQALRKNDWQTSVQISGVIGHYIGDMTQPMHATVDYDGQSIQKPGIHKYYETTLVDRLNEQRFFDAVVVSAGPRRSELERSIGNVMDQKKLQHVAYKEATAAYTALESVLIKFDRGGEDKWLTADLQPRVARASAMLAKLWDVAFTTAELERTPVQSIRAKEPAWIPMN